jgi:endonuclease YncB( thermonuclease family)
VRIATLLVVALAFGATSPATRGAPAGDAWTGTVTRVSDGDTLWVRPAEGGRPVKVRLKGVDAPEICQAGGRDARRALERRVLRRTVRLETVARDNWGRRIARVSLDGQDVGERLVLDGHAWNDRFRFHTGPYVDQEAQARAARRGVFADLAAVEPREFRRTHGACVQGQPAPASVPAGRAPALPGVPYR